jgi:Domain of unknown function (DUF3846)
MTVRVPTRGLLIPADPDLPVLRRTFANLSDYQATVGGMIDAVDIRVLQLSLYFSEEGLVTGLPFNQRATFLWWLHDASARHHAVLTGDVCAIGMPDRDGNDTHVRESVASLLTGPGKYAVQAQLPGGWYSTGLDFDAYLDAVVIAGLLLVGEDPVPDVRVAPPVKSPHSEPCSPLSHQ